MTLRTILLLLAFLPFMALTSHVVIIYGFDGFYIEAFQNAATTLLLTDLAISLILIQIWMWFDAKKTGRNPWPYYAITVTIGIAGPLLYLLLGKTAEERDTGATAASQA